MFVILDGEIDILCEGISIVKAIPGETLGEMSLVDKE